MVVLTPGKLTQSLIVWDSANDSLDNSQHLKQIAQWWIGLDNISVQWNGWFFSCTLHPMLVKQLILQDPQSDGSKLYWRLENSPGAFSLTPSKMVLDSRWQVLDIIIRTKSFNQESEQKHRVEVVSNGARNDRRR